MPKSIDHSEPDRPPLDQATEARLHIASSKLATYTIARRMRAYADCLDYLAGLLGTTHDERTPRLRIVIAHMRADLHNFQVASRTHRPCEQLLDRLSFRAYLVELPK